MKTRIYNARVLTMKDQEELFLGEVHIENDVITYVGTAKETDEKWDKEIDACGNVIMPGFKNAHTHSAMTFVRSYADDLKLNEWLYDKIFPAEGKLTGESLYWFTRLAFLEYLTSGITSAYDMYFHIDDGARAAKDTGFRYVFCDSTNNFGGSAETMKNDYLRMNADPSGLISYTLGFHAEYTTSAELMKSIADLANEMKLPVAAHVSETVNEVEGCRERYGMSPIAYLDSIGMFNYGGTIYHGVYPDEADYEILKKRGVYVITNPSSNLKLASGVAPIKRYLEEGIPVGIGTDGAGSNNCLDMFREMFLVTALQKGTLLDPEAVPAMEVLKMATVNGALAMGLTDCDVLAAGKKADIIMIDLSQPNMQPVQNIEKNIVYSGCKSNIKMTMIAGKVLYQDGEFFLDIPKEEIYEKANAFAREILG